jgi:hypothetical protein
MMKTLFGNYTSEWILYRFERRMGLFVMSRWSRLMCTEQNRALAIAYRCDFSYVQVKTRASAPTTTGLVYDLMTAPSQYMQRTLSISHHYCAIRNVHFSNYFLEADEFMSHARCICMSGYMPGCGSTLLSYPSLTCLEGDRNVPRSG